MLITGEDIYLHEARYTQLERIAQRHLNKVEWLNDCSTVSAQAETQAQAVAQALAQTVAQALAHAGAQAQAHAGAQAQAHAGAQAQAHVRAQAQAHVALCKYNRLCVGVIIQ